MRLFVNKAWGYGEPDPTTTSSPSTTASPSCRAPCASRAAREARRQRRSVRVANAAAPERAAREGQPGSRAPRRGARRRHSYWRYCLLIVDPAVVPGGPAALAAGAEARGIASAPRYIQKPAFRCEVFADQRHVRHQPLAVHAGPAGGRRLLAERFPGTFAALEQVLVLPWNERYTDEHVDFLGTSIIDAAASLEAEWR